MIFYKIIMRLCQILVPNFSVWEMKMQVYWETTKSPRTNFQLLLHFVERPTLRQNIHLSRQFFYQASLFDRKMTRGTSIGASRYHHNVYSRKDSHSEVYAFRCCLTCSYGEDRGMGCLEQKACESKLKRSFEKLFILFFIISLSHWLIRLFIYFKFIVPFFRGISYQS